MTSDEEMIERLRGAERTVDVRPSGDLWAGVRARVPGERRRRVARRAAPAVACAVAAAGIAAGLTLAGGTGKASLAPADLPPAPRITQLQPVTFTPDEAAHLVIECLQSGPGPADPARFQPGGLTVWAAARDVTGATVILSNPSTFVDCDVPADAAGRLDIDGAYVYSWGTGHDAMPRTDLELEHASGSHGIGGGFGGRLGAGFGSGPGDSRTVHDCGGRVSARVARVTATTPSGEIVEVPIQDGKVVVRTLQIDPPEPGPRPGEPGFEDFRRNNPTLFDDWYQANRPVVRAYDRDGRLLAATEAG
ncbi:hypothetical protein Franean1_0090 [Parafrankia sp. EAN1pec]|uniref:hypothetical protein n=1 Tax=Parafrankia sp. (strain EAN1pec) TaxID=298653 RepID=UPI0000541B5D|nr:hypothetical protein Franean1_0090 [Frankia sp. EAN1pec]